MTGSQRSAIALLVDQAIREREAERKWCGRCCRLLPLEEFYVRDGKRGSGWCQVCNYMATVDARRDKVAA